MTLVDAFNNEEFSDVTFVIGPSRTQFYAHRVIVAQCPYFKSALGRHWKESNQPFEKLDMDPEVFCEIMQFLYSSEINVPTDKTIEFQLQMITACEELQLKELQAAWLGILTPTRENVCAIWNAVHGMTLNVRFLSQCLELFKSCFTDKDNNNNYPVDLTESALESLLSNDHFYVSEETVAEIIKGWAKTQVDNTKAAIDRLRHCVRVADYFADEYVPPSSRSYLYCPDDQMLASVLARWKIGGSRVVKKLQIDNAASENYSNYMHICSTSGDRYIIWAMLQDGQSFFMNWAVKEREGEEFLMNMNALTQQLNVSVDGTITTRFIHGYRTTSNPVVCRLYRFTGNSPFTAIENRCMFEINIERMIASINLVGSTQLEEPIKSISIYEIDSLTQ